ncbi:DinB family protein [Flavivirga eckloniae]|uniref:DinB superfamily protein n=1 Tax=Flavivirga eckloniae TaxID=1803846 RepID=A0A2K9PVL1_9FLAO|nr:DinB family protein [Flavivirga eckloniae]AUP81110.1 DinB superfamily protein [Flavivirga eckloniae]
MLTKTLIKIFNRDLNKLKIEITSYKNEEDLWLLSEEISNTAGNLCLHIVGNLNHFIGATLGTTGYVRQREQEFSLKNVLRTELLQQIDDTIQMVESVLGNLSAEDLEKRYPIDVFKAPMTTEYFLVHLTTHLSYHLGQINYHRRLIAS